MVDDEIIDLNLVFDHGWAGLKVLLSKFYFKLQNLYLKEKENNKFFDARGYGFFDSLLKLLRFIDACGILFYQDYIRILEKDKEYGRNDLTNAIDKWEKEAGAQLFVNLVDTMKEFKE